MFDYLPLGWLQLKHQKLRLLSAILGIAFAVILIFVQLEFREALFVSAVQYHSGLDYGLVMVSPKTEYMINAKEFPRNRLYQAQGIQGVSTVTPIYSHLARWRNPIDRSRSRSIFVLGFDPSDVGFARILTPQSHDEIKTPDQIIFDRMGRDEYGPVADLMEAKKLVRTEVNDREVTVTSLYAIGTSFGLDGGIITSDLNFLRMFPKDKKSAITIGLIHLDTGQDPQEVQARIRSNIPRDVLVLTRQQFKELEIEYWNNTTPIGYIFAFGAIIGVVVGLIIVYQILFADVQDHLSEYATLKAMGYTQGYLRNVILQQATILAVLGFLPGLGLSILLFDQAAGATRLPLEMSVESALQIFTLTVAMCAGSGLLTLRKLRGIDPADVF
jgi:putative ABC transport system permease protein